MSRKGAVLTKQLGIIFITILMVLVIFMIVGPMLVSENVGPQTKYDNIILRISKEYRIEVALVKAMMKVGSDFDPALSGDRMGLMAITQRIIDDLKRGESSDHCRKMEVSDPNDAEQNTEAGVCYLSYLLDRYNNNKVQAVVAYHWEPSKFDSVGRDIEAAPANSRSYAKNVMEFYDEYKKNVGFIFI